VPRSHPFQRRPRSHRRLWLIVLIVLSLVPAVLGPVSNTLHEDEPGGASIFDFELAGSVERAGEILATWEAEGVVDDAKAIQLVDIVYPLVYAAALAGACVAAAGARGGAGRPRLARLGIGAAWIAFAAACFDYLENVGLAFSLWGEPAAPWPQLAYGAAMLKFAAIAIALAYGLSGVAAALAPAARRAPA
jgi:hypothetical protein